MRIQLPDYGVFLHWPEKGVGWIHPDDVTLVTDSVPSRRVFKRIRFDGTYYHLKYGGLNVRTRPVMWLAIAADGIDLGDRVEVSGVGLQREPFVGEVVGMEFYRRTREIKYTVQRAGVKQKRLYVASELKELSKRVSLASSDFSENRISAS